jgi:hypothetical protein
MGQNPPTGPSYIVTYSRVMSALNLINKSLEVINLKVLHLNLTDGDNDDDIDHS